MKTALNVYVFKPYVGKSLGLLDSLGMFPSVNIIFDTYESLEASQLTTNYDNRSLTA